MKPLPRKFYERHTAAVARDLVGKMLVRRINGHTLSGIISETEAYTAADPASHAYRGKTERNRAMFGPAGHAYVYFIYGNHHCLNVVAKRGKAGAVLIRAVIPAGGFRGKRILADGPGKLAQAMGIDKRLYGVDMTKRGALFIADAGKSFRIKRTPRIGIRRAKEKKWRFVVK